MPPTRAVVSGGTITTLVLMDDATEQSWRAAGFIDMLWPGSTLVDVTALDPQPQIGWAYDGATFTPPPEPEPEPEPDPVPDVEPTPDVEPEQPELESEPEPAPQDAPEPASDPEPATPAPASETTEQEARP